MEPTTHLQTHADYLEALNRAEQLCAADPPFDSDDGRTLDALVAVIEVYEREHYPDLQ